MKAISIIYCLIYAMCIVEAAINVEGFEGGAVSFQCSHSMASTNTKYLCKDPCKDKHVLISVQPGGQREIERISLVDKGDGAFNVTITGLQRSDSGTYWCGVSRVGLDTYEEVQLTVLEGHTTSAHTTEAQTQTAAVTQPTATTTLTSVAWTFPEVSYVTDTISGMETNTSVSKETLVYVSVASFVMATVLAAMIVGLRKWRGSCKPQSCSHTTHAAAEQESDCDYENIGRKDHQRNKLTIKAKGIEPTCSYTSDKDANIYANTSDPHDTVKSGYSTAPFKSKHHVPSVVYGNAYFLNVSKMNEHSSTN